MHANLNKVITRKASFCASGLALAQVLMDAIINVETWQLYFGYWSRDSDKAECIPC